jgi:murein DD-endopeptidase MepM/ murein hydrolase activator NlpD
VVNGQTSNYVLHKLKLGVNIPVGTILGEVGPATPPSSSHIYFQVQQTGKRTYFINPEVFLIALQRRGRPQDLNTSAANLNYVNPFIGAEVSPSRINQGVDYSVNGPVRAIGAGTVVHVGNSIGLGPYLAYKLSSGLYAGKFVYVSDGIVSNAFVGEKIAAGQVIAYCSGGIETGFAQGSAGHYLPLAQSTGGWDPSLDAINATSAAGASFNRLMVSLGVPGAMIGAIQVGSVVGFDLP